MTQIPEPPVVLFDGICKFCNRTVNFLIQQDRGGQLRFAALQSEAGQRLLRQHGLAGDNFQSFVLLEKGIVFQKSTAALRLLSYLPWHWQWARLGWLLPVRLRDAVYQKIAANRYRWFGKKEQCMIPDAGVRSRFL